MYVRILAALASLLNLSHFFQRFVKSSPKSHGWAGTTYTFSLLISDPSVFQKVNARDVEQLGKIRSLIATGDDLFSSMETDFEFPGCLKGRKRVYLPHNNSPRC